MNKIVYSDGGMQLVERRTKQQLRGKNEKKPLRSLKNLPT
jgi:hypothetical protein